MSQRLVDRAHELAESGLWATAAEYYAVAADETEEAGHAFSAFLLRASARRMLVLEWAERRWPDDEIDLNSVWPIRETRQGLAQEVTLFDVRPHGGRKTYRVRVDERGHIREELSR